MSSGATDARPDETLVEGLAAALAPAFDGASGEARALAEAVAAALSTADPEASLRIADGRVRGGRMMLERADAACARRIAEGLALPWTPLAEAVVASCRALELPLITGWDVGAPAPVYKLYANASDASVERRQELGRRLGLSGGPPAHVVGLNVAREAAQLKVYRQAERLEAPGGAPVPVPEAFAAIDAVAWVASHDVRGEAQPLRALFAAPAHDGAASAREALRALTGISWEALADRFPFAPGPLRQLGWSPSGAVTVYAKRRGAAAPVHALSPVAVFRAGDVEVGLYVAPTADAPRAFVRTERHALTFRTRQGDPPGPAIEALGRWAAARVARAERRGERPSFAGPPPPWVRRTER